MARGDQLARQWKIIQILIASRRGRSVAGLAGDLGCHTRTVYRDLEALQEAGFPVYTERIEGRSLWSILESAKHQIPLPLSIPELMALYVGRGIMKALKATVFYDALESLFAKIRTTLPEAYLQYFGHIEKSLGVGAKSSKTYEWMNGIFEVISDAIVRRRFIDMTYFTMSRKQETHRKVAPYKIWFFDGSFYLIGNCGLREDVRIFALDRIRNVSLNPEAFEMPEDFDVEEFMKPSFGIFRGEPVEVRIRFAPDIAGFIGERRWHPSQKSVLERDGALILEMTVAGTEEIKFWTLQWGSRAEVLKPATLRRQILEEGRKLSKMYWDPMKPDDPAD